MYLLLLIMIQTIEFSQSSFCSDIYKELEDWFYILQIQKLLLDLTQ